jgi:hypothetical protein
MKNDGMRIKHPKLRSEWAELRFMTRAAEYGLCVTKPWGETARYDFAVEHEGHFVRVQVKSTMFVDRGGYSCSVRGCSGPYEGDPFDYLAVYLIPEDFVVHHSGGEGARAGECGAVSETEEVEV